MYKDYVKDIMKIYDKEEDELEELEKKNLTPDNEEKEAIKIISKYDNLLIENNKKYNVIFRYDLEDCYGVQVSTLVITNAKENNVWCVYADKDTEEYLTIDSSIIEDILSNYINEIKNINIDHENTLDGVVNTFYFDVNNCTKEIKVNNLIEWNENLEENTKVLLDVFDELYKVLYRIDKNIGNCLLLDYENEEESDEEIDEEIEE